MLMRSLSEGELYALRTLRSNPEIADWFFSPTMEISEEQQRRWYERVREDPTHEVFVAIDKPNIEWIVGYGQLYDIDALHRSAEVGVVVAPAFQGQGYGTKITEWLVDHAFNGLNLNCLMARVLGNNVKASAMFLKCGFEDRGMLPQIIWKNGQYRDVRMYLILRPDH